MSPRLAAWQRGGTWRKGMRGKLERTGRHSASDSDHSQLDDLWRAMTASFPPSKTPANRSCGPTSEASSRRILGNVVPAQPSGVQIAAPFDLQRMNHFHVLNQFHLSGVVFFHVSAVFSLLPPHSVAVETGGGFPSFVILVFRTRNRDGKGARCERL